MSEPRDRHEAYAAPPPPWNLRIDCRDENGWDEGELVALKPDDPIRKIFEARPHLDEIILISGPDGRMDMRYVKITPPGPPDYGMGSDEGNAAVDLAVRTAAATEPTVVGGHELVRNTSAAIAEAIVDFGRANGVDFTQARSQAVRGEMEMRLADYRLDEEPS